MESELWGLFWKAVNFIILAVLLYKLLANRIKEFFKNRSKTIEKEIKDADTEKINAERRFEELRKKIENIEKERERLIEMFKNEGLAEKERIIESAKKEAEKIRQQAIRTFEQEEMKAISAIRKEYAESIIEIAKNLIRDKLTDKDHDRVITEYIEKVVKLN
ncbi:MAG: ATP synthase F0 subunit B [Thermodesulfobacteriota bacterium]|nr:ATP synthase F0 subunit B [Thermodesulfobacteriota bacterium]